MERIIIFIESTRRSVPCLLNPEDREGSLTIRRSSGLAREESGNLSGKQLSDSPVQARGLGDTRLELKLLFDVSLSDKPLLTDDVRELTLPLFQLTEYTANQRQAQSGSRAGTSVLRGQSKRALPKVRIIWGKGWDIPAVVESVAERYERFTEDGRPQRSWMTLGLLRVSDEIPSAELPARILEQTLPELEKVAAADLAGMQLDYTWGVHVKLGEGTEGDQLWQLAAHYLGDPRLWRWIAIVNNIADPKKIPAGTPLRIPPLSVLAMWLKGRQAK